MIDFIGSKIKTYKAMIPVMIIMTAMTLIFIYIFGIGFTQQFIPKVLIVDQDQTDSSKMMIERLEANDQYAFTKSDLEQGLKKLEGKKVMAVVLFDQDFEKNLSHLTEEVVYYKSGETVEQNSLKRFLGEVIGEVVTDLNFSEKVSIGFQSDQQALYQEIVGTTKDYVTFSNNASFFNKGTSTYSAIKHYFSGFMLFFSMFIIMFGIGNIVDEKEVGVWNRQKVSPMSPGLILMGNLITNFIVGMAQMIFVVLVSKFVFHIEWGGSTIAMLLVLGAYVIAGTAMGLFIVSFTKTQQQLAAVLPTIIVSSSMIGGCMWPIELVKNKFLLFIANLLPQRWGMEGLSKIMMYDGTIQDVLWPIAYLLIIAAVMMALAIIPYKKSA